MMEEGVVISPLQMKYIPFDRLASILDAIFMKGATSGLLLLYFNGENYLVSCGGKIFAYDDYLQAKMYYLKKREEEGL